MAPPPAVGRSGRKFRDWRSQEWADIVAHPDPEQRARHLLAGTAVDILNGLRAWDPKRLAIYFTKHSSPNKLGDKEYQKIVPEAWREPGHGPIAFGGPWAATSNRSRGDRSGRGYRLPRGIGDNGGPGGANQALLGGTGGHGGGGGTGGTGPGGGGVGGTASDGVGGSDSASGGQAGPAVAA